MPLLIVPYTMGSFQGAAGAAPTGGAAYYTRRRRYVEWLFGSIVLMLLTAC